MGAIPDVKSDTGRPPPPYVISFLIFSWKRIKVEFVRLVAITLERRVVAGLGFSGELEMLQNSSLCLVSASSSALSPYHHCVLSSLLPRSAALPECPGLFGSAAASMPAEFRSGAHFARGAYQRHALFTHIAPSFFCFPLILKI